MIQPLKTSETRHMRRAVLLALIAVAQSPASVWSQTPFPPPALLTAQSIDAAAGVLGVGRPEYSSHLLVDVPEISLPGRVTATLRSELPGTVYLVLLRAKATLAEPTSTKPAAKSSTRPALTKTPSPVAAATQPPPVPTVFIAARKIEPGEAPEFKASFELTGADAVTLLAYAQGRWFVSGREIKLARPPAGQP